MSMRKIMLGILALIALPILVLVVVHTPPIPAVASPPAMEAGR